MVGLVEVPVWTMGLPAGWLFGVPATSSAFHWTFPDAHGKRVLLSIMGADVNRQDLYVLNLQATEARPPVPETGTGGGSDHGR
jgi:hypothetical protein